MYVIFLFPKIWYMPYGQFRYLDIYLSNCMVRQTFFCVSLIEIHITDCPTCKQSDRSLDIFAIPILFLSYFYRFNQSHIPCEYDFWFCFFGLYLFLSSLKWVSLLKRSLVNISILHYKSFWKLLTLSAWMHSHNRRILNKQNDALRGC